MTDEERQQFVALMKALYAQNIGFLTSVENGTAKKRYKTSTIDKFKKRNSELADYIIEIANGADYTRTLKEWCNIFGDILVGGDSNGSH